MTLQNNITLKGIVLRNTPYTGISICGANWKINNVKILIDLFNRYQADGIDIYGYNHLINDVPIRSTDANLGVTSEYAGWPEFREPIPPTLITFRARARI